MIGVGVRIHPFATIAASFKILTDSARKPLGPEGNSAFCRALSGMAHIFQRPVIIASIVAVFSIITMGIVNHTNLVVDHRPPLTPPGTTFHTVKDAGAEMSPTQPVSPLEPPRSDPAPLAPKK